MTDDCADEHDDGNSRKKAVKLIHQEMIPKDRIQEWIDANGLPGDTVVVTDPETGDETRHYVQNIDQ